MNETRESGYIIEGYSAIKKIWGPVMWIRTKKESDQELAKIKSGHYWINLNQAPRYDDYQSPIFWIMQRVTKCNKFRIKKGFYDQITKWQKENGDV